MLSAETTTTDTTTTIETTTSATTSTTATTTTTSTTTETTTTTATTAVTIGEIVTGTTTVETGPDIHGMTPEYYAFLQDTVFVGDSICSGLKVYKILPDDHVAAKGSVAARNIFDFKFDVRNGSFGITYALTLLKPKYVIFSMGMNDINMTTTEQFCENYDFLLDTVQSVLPDAQLYVASVTPVLPDIEFTTNEKLDTYNAALKTHLSSSDYDFLDIASGLKTTANAMNPDYNGGDGIHLAPAAYYVILRQICEQLVDTNLVGGSNEMGAYGWKLP